MDAKETWKKIRRIVIIVLATIFGTLLYVSFRGEEGLRNTIGRMRDALGDPDTRKRDAEEREKRRVELDNAAEKLHSRARTTDSGPGSTVESDKEFIDRVRNRPKDKNP